MCCCLLNEVDCLLGSQHRVPKIPCLFSISIPSLTQMVEDDSIFYRFHEDLPLILFQHHVHSLRKRQYTKISNTNIELLFLAGLAIACCLCRRLQRSEVLLAAQCRCYCIGCSLHFTIAQFSFCAIKTKNYVLIHAAACTTILLLLHTNWNLSHPYCT